MLNIKTDEKNETPEYVEMGDVIFLNLTRPIIQKALAGFANGDLWLEQMRSCMNLKQPCFFFFF